MSTSTLKAPSRAGKSRFNARAVRSCATVLASLVLVLTGCDSGDSRDEWIDRAPDAGSQAVETFDVEGTFTLIDPDGITYDCTGATCTCAGADGYDDVRAGTQVQVTDESGEVVGLGRLADEGARTAGSDGDILSMDVVLCAFEFTIADVPAGRRFYQLEVGHRGALSYTEAELRRPLALELGGASG